MVLIAGFAFFLNLVPGTALQLASARWGVALSQILFIAGPVGLGIRWFYLDPASVLPYRRPRLAEIAAALSGALGLNHLLTLYGAWQESVFPTPEMLRALYEGLFVYRGPVDFLALITIFALLPGVCEEMLFRGFLHAGFARLVDRPVAGLVVGGVVFGLFHLDPWRFVGITALGVFLGYLRSATGSLLPAVVAHAANNIASISLAATGRLAELSFPASAATVAVALLLVAVVPILLRAARRPRDPAMRML